MSEISEFHPGDKLRVKSGEHKAKRGVLLRLDAAALIIGLDSGEEVRASIEQITNFSLAARRAWQAMPKRSGRPKSTITKKMVSIRIGRDCWERLGRAVEMGLIVSKEAAVNMWLEQHVDELLNLQSDADQHK